MIDVMPKPRKPYLHREKTRHGKIVWYFRRSISDARIRIAGDYGSPEFEMAYDAAFAGKPVVKNDFTPHKGSLKWLVDKWTESSDFLMKAKSTQRQRENILVRILDKNGVKQFRQITKADIVAGRERRMKTPFAANNYIKTMKALFAWAKEMNLVSADPAKDVAMLSRKTDGHEPWTKDDVAAYRAKWPLGDRRRVAFEVIYQTGLRRGDAVRLGWQHIGHDGKLRIKTEKTGAVAAIRPTRALVEAINMGPTGDLAFIAGEAGKPFSKESFGNEFRGWCNQAGVSKSAHGLRKLAAIEVAEAGGTDEEIDRMFTWAGKGQSKVYTRLASSEKLADAAMMKREGNNSISAPVAMVRKGVKK